MYITSQRMLFHLTSINAHHVTTSYGTLLLHGASFFYHHSCLLQRKRSGVNLLPCSQDVCINSRDASSAPETRSRRTILAKAPQLSNSDTSYSLPLKKQENSHVFLDGRGPTPVRRYVKKLCISLSQAKEPNSHRNKWALRRFFFVLCVSFSRRDLLGASGAY